jgi:hypothetical protein
MRKPLYDKKVLRERGLVTNGFYLPYNPKLTARANELRKKYSNYSPSLPQRFFLATKDGGFPFKGQCLSILI